MLLEGAGLEAVSPQHRPEHAALCPPPQASLQHCLVCAMRGYSSNLKVPGLLDSATEATVEPWGKLLPLAHPGLTMILKDTPLPVSKLTYNGNKVLLKTIRLDPNLLLFSGGEAAIVFTSHLHKGVR